jgi:hypothetical protein
MHKLHGTNINIRASKGVYPINEMPAKNRIPPPTGGGIWGLKGGEKHWKFGHLRAFESRSRYPKKATPGNKALKKGIFPYRLHKLLAKNCTKAYNWQ